MATNILNTVDNILLNNPCPRGFTPQESPCVIGPLLFFILPYSCFLSLSCAKGSGGTTLRRELYYANGMGGGGEMLTLQQRKKMD